MKILDKIILILLSLIVYLLVFIVPIILFLRLKDRVNPLTFLKLNNNIKNGLLKGFSISILFIVLLFVKNIVFGWNYINIHIGILWFTGAMVGILEEIPFRGFLLQKLNNYMHFIPANLITTALFILIHMPILLINKVSIINSIKSIILVSYILGYLFKESDSLWVPIICHSFFDLTIFIGLG